MNIPHLKQQTIEEFNKQFDYSMCCGGDYCEDHNAHDKEEKQHVRQFVLSIIDTLVDQIREEVKLRRLGGGGGVTGEYERMIGYNSAIETILALLESKEGKDE